MKGARLRTKLPVLTHKTGAITLEFLLNFLIYLVVFLFLFNLAVLPLKIFYLKTAARDAAIIYTQLAHFKDKDLHEEAVKIMGEDFKSVIEEDNKSISLIKVGGNYNKKDVAEAVSYYITKDFTKKSSLTSYLFDTNNMIIEINDDNYASSFFGKIGKFMQGFISTYEVTVTIKYNLSIFKVINLNLIGTPVTASGSCIIKYNIR